MKYTHIIKIVFLIGFLGLTSCKENTDYLQPTDYKIYLPGAYSITDVIQLDDGSLILLGIDNKGSYPVGDLWAIKINPDGQQEWSNHFEATTNYNFPSSAIANNNQISFIAHDFTGSKFLFSIDTQNGEFSQKQILSDLFDEYILRLLPHPDGGFLMISNKVINEYFFTFSSIIYTDQNFENPIKLGNFLYETYTFDQVAAEYIFHEYALFFELQKFLRLKIHKDNNGDNILYANVPKIWDIASETSRMYLLRTNLSNQSAVIHWDTLFSDPTFWIKDFDITPDNQLSLALYDYNENAIYNHFAPIDAEINIAQFTRLSSALDGSSIVRCRNKYLTGSTYSNQVFVYSTTGENATIGSGQPLEPTTLLWNQEQELLKIIGIIKIDFRYKANFLIDIPADQFEF